MNFQRAIPIGEFDRICNQMKQYLLKSFFVSFDNIAKLLEARETYFNFDSFHFYFFLQDFIDILNALRNVERCYVLDEVFVIILEESVIKHVVYKVIDELDTIWHLVYIDFYPLVNELQFILNLNDELIWRSLRNINILH